jgi:hypothetical protein
MSTTFGELIRQVMLRLQKVDGITRIAVEQAINDAQRVVACVRDFDELKVLDTANAKTVAGQKIYHIENDLKLVRPKDIYTIRLMDGANSRKLDYVPFRELDARVPYTEIATTGRPRWYTVRGRYIELFCIPDKSYDLYIQHSQWPRKLVNESDETDYLNIDHVIVALAADMAMSVLEGSSGDWAARAQQLLGISLTEEETRPDQMLVARPFQATPTYPVGSYWLNPWVKRQP